MLDFFPSWILALWRGWILSGVYIFVPQVFLLCCTFPQIYPITDYFSLNCGDNCYSHNDSKTGGTFFFFCLLGKCVNHYTKISQTGNKDMRKWDEDWCIHQNENPSLWSMPIKYDVQQHSITHCLWMFFYSPTTAVFYDLRTYGHF